MCIQETIMPHNVCVLIYTLSTFFVCADINECALATDACNQNCHNTAGGYTCSCNTGYILNSDRRTCRGLSLPCTSIKLMHITATIADIDECSSSSTNGCQDICVNNLGSYTCQCRTGYSLNADGRMCTGVMA